MVTTSSIVPVSGLSTVAMCAPSEKFLNMGGILGAGLGVVLVSSIGKSFLKLKNEFNSFCHL